MTPNPHNPDPVLSALEIARAVAITPNIEAEVDRAIAIHKAQMEVIQHLDRDRCWSALVAAALYQYIALLKGG